LKKILFDIRIEELERISPTQTVIDVVWSIPCANCEGRVHTMTFNHMLCKDWWHINKGFRGGSFCSDDGMDGRRGAPLIK
jgi:hypothetical protein